MTQTQAPAENGQETPVQARNAYLPVPPDGWEYVVELIGPKGARVVAGRGLEPNTHAVEVKAKNVSKTVYVSTLKDGVRVAVDAAKALSAMAVHEQQFETQKQKLLATIGGESETVSADTSTEN